ncbi:discoidin domain-containing protein [Nocardia vaccinii]|uniref:discoidin domain-containing protein n=1 Tax=Nocardia vaccinii TaxID=1822 RepID=UPI000832BE4B|nr:discoidin domain-containing protein [Nocardia vaccinii]
MSAEDPGDVFVRHRGAVLDALLAHPSFGQSAQATAAAPIAEPFAEPIAGEFSTRAGVISAPDPVPGEPLIEPDSMPTGDRRRANGTPKASDRIMALLNGESPDESPGMEFSSEFSEMAAGRLRNTSATSAAPPPDPEPESASASAAPPATGAAASATKVVELLRRPKVALAVVGVLAIVLVLILVTTGGRNSSPNQVVVATPVAAGPASPAKTDAAGTSATIQVKSAVAHCPSGSTEGMDAFSGQPGKAWSCVRAYKVDGQVLTIDLGKTYQVDSIGIVPGWDSAGADGADQWSKYRTVSRLSYQFNDSNTTTYTQQTMDQRSLVVTKIDPPVSASKITLTVLASKGDASTNTVAISSIVITGH